MTLTAAAIAAIAATLGHLAGRRRRTSALDAKQLDLAAAWAQIRDERQDVADEWQSIVEAREDMQRTCRAMLEEAGIEGQLS